MAKDKEEKIFTEAEQTKLLKKLKSDGGMALSFSFGLGSGPENHVLVLHRVLEGKKMWLKLKAAKGVKNGMYGKASVDGSILVLTPEWSKVVKKKDLKAYLMLNKPLAISKVKLLNPDGSEVADEDEEEPSEDLSERKKKLENSLKKMVGLIAGVIKNNPDSKSEILPLVKQIQDGLKADRLDQVKELMQRTVLAMKEAGAGPSGPAAPKVEDQEEQGAKETVAAPETDEAPSEHFQEATTLWRKGQTDLRAEILKVQKAIRAKIPQASTYDAKLEGFLFNYFADLFDQLERGLKKEGKNRTKIARSLVKQYRKDAKNNPVLKHLEKNPFAEVKLESILTSALNEIESKLVA